MIKIILIRKSLRFTFNCFPKSDEENGPRFNYSVCCNKCWDTFKCYWSCMVFFRNSSLATFLLKISAVSKILGKINNYAILIGSVALFFSFCGYTWSILGPLLLFIDIVNCVKHCKILQNQKYADDVQHLYLSCRLEVIELAVENQ